MPRTREPTDNVSALERGFEVLDCFAASQRPLGNGDVASATGIPRATVSRLIGTLVSLGHLRPSAGAAVADKYELAAGVVRLAHAFLGAIDIRSHARPHLAALAEATGASSLLGVRDGDDVLVVEAARSRSAVAVVSSDVGTRMSLATSALGRAWLIGVDAATRAAVLDQFRQRGAPPGAALDTLHHTPHHTPHHTSSARLATVLAQSSALGYAESIGEWHQNINAVAVPVRTPGGEVVTINCGGPAFVLSAQRLNEVVLPRILAAARALAHDIGGVAGLELTNQSIRKPEST